MLSRLLTGVLVVLLIVLGAPGAVADAGRVPNELTGSDPADGASLAAAPERIRLTFREPVDPDLVVISVTGADGRLWRVGKISASGATLTMPVTPAGPAGRCEIFYNVAAAEPVRGEVAFTLTAPAPSAPATSTGTARTDPFPDPRDSGVPIWVIVLAGAAVLGVAVGVMLAGIMRGRRP